MPLSCFTPCGLLRLSSEKPLAESIYDQIRKSHGPAYESEDFDGPQSARWYAMAMEFAAARATLERAKNQADPWKCSDLLTAHEFHYGLPVTADTTLYERHAALAAAMQLSNGPRRGNVEYQLQTALGEDFVAWVTTPADNFPETAFPEEPWNTVGIFDNPSLWKTVTLTQSIAFTGVPRAVSWTHLSGDSGTIAVGDRLVVEPGKLGQQELITVTARTASTLTAVFARPHEAGAEAIRRPWPVWASISKHSAVVVKNGRARDPGVKQTIYNLLRKLLGATSTWDVVEENAVPGTAGPMIPGAGTWLLDQTPLGTLTV